jgi:hypothetical protein
VCYKGECSSYTVNVHHVLSMEVCATKGNVRDIELMCTLYLLWKCMTQGECSRYVVNVHPVIAMELCAT